MSVMQKIVGKFDENNLEVLSDGKLFSSFLEFEKIKNNKWKELSHQIKKDGGKLWNGSVYRLSKITQSKNKYCLHLSIIDFKTHYATPSAIDLFKRRPFEERPNGIYSSAYIRTSEGLLVLGKRQKKGVVTRAEISLIGGSISPDERKISSIKDFYESFFKELKEETNISKNAVKMISGLGIYISDTFRIGVFLVADLFLSQKETQDTISLNDEHKELIFLTEQETQKILDDSRTHPNIKSTFNDYLNFTTPQR